MDETNQELAAVFVRQGCTTVGFSERRSCVKGEVAVLDSPSQGLIVLMASVDVK